MNEDSSIVRSDDSTFVEMLHQDQNLNLALAITPGRIAYLESASADNEPLTPAIASRLRLAFTQGWAHGLLQLGSGELSTHLPPSLAFGRDIAHLFMVRLCAVPDLESQWQALNFPTPSEELKQRLDTAPPMTGAEYLDLDCLLSWWTELVTAASAEITAAGGDVQKWLQTKAPAWNLVGRVYFHLAENKSDTDTPFAFLATYTHRISVHTARVQHLPLIRALKEYASATNRDALLKLLLPIHKAAQESSLVKELMDSGAIHHQLNWTPREAYHFLKDIPRFEAAGILVRIPDWWKPKSPPRPQITVNIGKGAASAMGLGALLDFSVELTLEGETLTAAEWRQILANTDGLALIKGRWVEVDRDRLQEALHHWQQVQRSVGDGISFLEGMRLLAGATLDGDKTALTTSSADWSQIIAGDWLRDALGHLRNPAGTLDMVPDEDFTAQLRPYQRVGVEWLWWLTKLRLGGCLADDMGLGKTIQLIALLVQLKRHGESGPHLLVVPASLIANWQGEIRRFAPRLTTFIAHPSEIATKDLIAWPQESLDSVDLIITSYGTLSRLPWMTKRVWSLVVLDEAQAIKNPGAQQTRTVKALRSRTRLALTGTPVENRLGDLWSLFDFICPGLLGSFKTFGRFAKHLAEEPQQSYAPLRNLVRPYILRRLKTDKQIISDLPDKTEVKAWCGLSKTQAVLYQQAIDELEHTLVTVEGIERRGVVLAYLLRFKQICNHPSQWLGDGGYAALESGKFARLSEIAESIAARQEKVLVFTQFKEMTEPLNCFLETVFGRPGLVLHGSTAVKQRKVLVDAFQQELGPPFFVLSIKAGGTGLTLTAASHVIHFDRWWNPAVENQATDRAYRIGQHRNVLVHKFVCRGTVEEKIDALIESKLGLSQALMEGGSELLLTEMSDRELLQLVALDIHSAAGDLREADGA
ncbi:DEAD/DEAH box helicase [Gammaproteobacteria bacterium]